VGRFGVIMIPCTMMLVNSVSACTRPSNGLAVLRRSFPGEACADNLVKPWTLPPVLAGASARRKETQALSVRHSFDSPFFLADSYDASFCGAPARTPPGRDNWCCTTWRSARAGRERVGVPSRLPYMQILSVNAVYGTRGAARFFRDGIALRLSGGESAEQPGGRGEDDGKPAQKPRTKVECGRTAHY
jgi:hypothetical protein